MAKRPEVLHDIRTVIYDNHHWNVLGQIRKRAIEVIRKIEASGISQSVVHGSVARGDVSETSDVDIIIPHPISSYRLELALGHVLHRELVQATPTMVLKGHIHLADNIIVSFPMFKLRPREEEFYHWGGLLDLNGLEAGSRISGVNSRFLQEKP